MNRHTIKNGGLALFALACVLAAPFAAAAEPTGALTLAKGEIELFIMLGIGVVGLIIFLFLLNFGSIYIQALTSGVKVTAFGLIGMWLRKVPPRTIVEGMIMARKSGLPSADIDRNQLESHYMAGGNVLRVIRALIAATKANIDLTYKMATSIDLAGREIREAVNTSVHTKVLDCPHQRRGRLTSDAMAMAGIQ